MGGGSPDVSPDFRHVVPSAEASSHQQSGTTGGSPRTSALPPPGHQQGRDSDDGQHHSRWSDQEPGRHTLMILVPPDCLPPRVAGQQTHHSGPAPHPGTSERGGQSIVPATPDHQLRVDTVSADTPPRVAPMGPAPRRPLATSETTRLPTYVSPLLDPAAWRTDALSFPWTDLWAYMFPPFPLIPEVLQRIQASNCHTILVAPAWPSQPWFPHLLSLLDDHPRRLPPRRKLLRQPRSRVFHPDPSRLSVHVWRLPSRPSSAEAIPRWWQPASPCHTVSPQSVYDSKWRIFT